jgi:GxxExxY protein
MLEVDDSKKRKLLHEETTSKIIGAAFEVHDQLGYGFLERVYQRAVQVELLRRGATAELEKRIQVHYKGAVVGDYDIDVLVDSCVAVEVKVAPQYDKRDEGQLLNELKATGLKMACSSISAAPKSSTNPWSSKSVFHPCSSVAK